MTGDLTCEILDDVESGEDNPVGEPLDIVLGVLGLEGLDGAVGRVGEPDMLGNHVCFKNWYVSNLPDGISHQLPSKTEGKP